MQANSRFI